MKKLSIALLMIFSAQAAMTQDIPLPFPSSPRDQHNRDSLMIDSALRAHETAPTIIKPYEDVVRGFKIQRGLFSVLTKGDTVYFEIPDSILHRDIMLIDRLAAGPGGYGAYPGEELNEQTILFDLDKDPNVLLRFDELVNEASDTASEIHKAVARANLKPIYLSFPIMAYGRDKRSYVIDVSKFLKEDKLINERPNSQGLKGVDDLKFQHVEWVHTYPINVEIRISKNGRGNGTAEDSPDGKVSGPVSLVTNTSFIELPETPLMRRFADPRVGYFTASYFAFGDHQQKVEKKDFIFRWRLEPKPEDVDKWKRGELVEPAKPIVFYIDPATPKQWRKYLILGVNDWQKAFEQAGFKNAIIGKEWPEGDTTMQMDDARFSFINYFPSTVENAYGPQLHDPRSGEIIQSHIGWYHNVMELLHNWYMVQAGATDPRARTARFDDELMGQLIRFVSSHEVGHTLGLRHNFGSSSMTPVDSLRSRTWLDKHGHTASIMDYARFNYVAQPEDHIPEEDLFPHIGEYDRWAIEWGYKSSGAADADEDHKIVGRWVTQRLAANPLLWWGDGEGLKSDPRRQMEDLGDDAAKAGTYGIKNLQRILPNLPEWTHEDGGNYEGLETTYKALEQQYYQYMKHALKYIGGVYTTVRSEGGPGDVNDPVPRTKQIEALDFFNKQLFTTPSWLMDARVGDKVMTSGSDFVQDVQIRVLNSLLSIDEINQVFNNSVRFGPAKTLAINEYIADIHRGLWRELEGTGPVVVEDPLRRNLQKAYIDNFSDILLANAISETGSDPGETDAFSIIKMDLSQLNREITAAIPKTTDAMTRYHLEDLKDRLKKALATAKDAQ